MPKTTILLTFTGFHDPFSQSLIEGQEEEGPILTLVREKKYDQVILFSTPKTVENTIQTAQCLTERFSGIKVNVRELLLEDPTDYFVILQGLRHHYSEIAQENPHSHYFIAVASGTPQMHACWLLLVASREIPATLLNVRPRRFATYERPLISEVDIQSSAFPSITPRKEIITRLDEEVKTAFADVIVKEGLIGRHRTFFSAIDTAVSLAPSDVPVLILGESGTGKELLARLIHRLSDRNDKPFIPVNCAAVPKQLAESFLFGHKKGAFTGALRDQIGKFDAADGGTLFLDELTELDYEIQAKMLRVLQDGFVEPLGSCKGHTVSVRIITATNKDVGTAISEGKFRDDLYYRLNVGEVGLPSLQERRSDIPLLSLHFLQEINQRLKNPKSFSPEALAFLQGQDWPGNIRELRNTIQRAVLISRGSIISSEDLKPSSKGIRGNILDLLPEPYPGFTVDKMLSDIRKHYFNSALEKAKGNQSEAARLLGVSPQAVSKFIKEKD